MKKLKQYSKEIYDLTLKIEQDYPELYQYLEENPVTIPSGGHTEVNIKVMDEYLESLRQILAHHIEHHGKNKVSSV